jgi:hypothetical protein
MCLLPKIILPDSYRVRHLEGCGTEAPTSTPLSRGGGASTRYDIEVNPPVDQIRRVIAAGADDRILRSDTPRRDLALQPRFDCQQVMPDAHSAGQR